MFGQLCHQGSSVTIVFMLIGSFFTWWYGPGWKKVSIRFERRINLVMQDFSVTQLLRTLFSPWRRIITYPGAGIAERWRAWNDNLFSRLIGFIVRVFVLLAAMVVVVLIALLTLVEFIIWPLMPLAVPVCLVVGIIL